MYTNNTDTLVLNGGNGVAVDMLQQCRGETV